MLGLGASVLLPELQHASEQQNMDRMSRAALTQFAERAGYECSSQTMETGAQTVVLLHQIASDLRALPALLQELRDVCAMFAAQLGTETTTEPPAARRGRLKTEKTR